MSRFGEVMNNIIIGKRKGGEIYNRIFIVSAYGGITNLLLEDKKTGEPGVYGKFAAGDKAWVESLEKTRKAMLDANRTFESIGLDLKEAEKFVNERIDGIKYCLDDLMKVRSFGHFKPSTFLPASREFLASVGEAHSAFNSALILKKNGINACFVDLTGWKDTEILTIDDMIIKQFKGIDFASELPIVTGYVKYNEGIMTHYDRGYSEITFSKIAVITKALEGVIHKEFHLSTGDPKLMGVNNVKIIGNTNFDIADQLSDMDMEAIHPKASKEMELNDIPIRVKNAFDPEHSGTLITRDYVSPKPRVEMICGRNDIVAIDVYDPEMVGQSGYDHKLLEAFSATKISYIAKNTNANTITHYVSQKKSVDKCVELIKKLLPGAKVSTHNVCIVAVIGTNMKIPGFLARAAKALAEANINILALDQTLRQVTMQFILSRNDFKQAQVALHKEFVEKD